MADEKEPTKVEVVDTDLQSDENPFNSNGFVGVDPYFQSDQLDPKKGEEKPEEKKESAPATSVKTPAPTAPVTPPK